MSAVEKFPVLLLDAEEESSAVPPCFSHEGINVRDPTSPLHSEARIQYKDFEQLTWEVLELIVPLHTAQ